MFKSVCRWFFSAIFLLIAKVLAVVLAPVGCLFVRTERHEFRIRDYAVNWFAWAVTHDAPLDEGYVGGYFKYPVTALGRWWCRVKWVWRNPAYQTAHWLGYDQVGMVLIKHKDQGHLWDTGAPNFSIWTAKNSNNQIAWMLEWQWYFYRNRCLEVYLGWKLHRKDPDRRCMLVARITPFKKYP